MTRRDCSLTILGLAGAARLAAQGGDGTGPAAGKKIPAFTALDQHGQRRDFASLAGPNGLLLVFHRSADW